MMSNGTVDRVLLILRTVCAVLSHDGEVCSDTGGNMMSELRFPFCDELNLFAWIHSLFAGSKTLR